MSFSCAKEIESGSLSSVTGVQWSTLEHGASAASLSEVEKQVHWFVDLAYVFACNVYCSFSSHV